MTGLHRVPALVAAIAIAGCGSRSVRTVVPAQRHPPAPRTSMELRVIEWPLFGRPRAADDTGERWIAGGVRFEIHDRGPTIASVLSMTELTAARVGDAWLFVDSANGRVLRSSEFLGDLTPHGAADTYIGQCVGPTSDRLFLKGEDGRLFDATADEPLAPVEALAQSAVVVCAVDAASNVFVGTSGGVLRSADGGRSWMREASSAAAEVAFASGTHALFDRPRASVEALGATMQLLLGQLAGPADPNDVGPAESPGQGCQRFGLRIAACDSGVFVARREGEWQHVAAPAPDDASSVASPDGARVLLGWGCHGEHGRLCLVDARDASTTTIGRALNLRDARVLGDRAVHLVSDDGTLLTVDLETGVTRARTLGGPFLRPQVVEVTALTGGGVACTVGDREDDDALRLELVSADGATVTDVALPERAARARMLDATHGIAIDRDGRVLRTDDAGGHWTDSGARAVDPSSGELSCDGQACAGETFLAQVVPSTTPARTFELDRPPRTPHRVTPYELIGAGGARRARHIVHEVRQRKLWVSVTWETSLGRRSAEGFLHGYGEDGDEWSVVVANEHAAILHFYDQDGPAYVLARAGGRVSRLQSDLLDGVPITTALDGSIVLWSSAAQIVRPNGRIEVLAGTHPAGLRFLPDGRVERAWLGTTLSGAVRAVTESDGASVLELAGARPCETSTGIVARWWLPEELLPFEIRDWAESPPHTRAVIDVDAAGRACVRSIAVDATIYEAAPGGALVGPDAALRPAEP